MSTEESESVERWKGYHDAEFRQRMKDRKDFWRWGFFCGALWLTLFWGVFVLVNNYMLEQKREKLLDFWIHEAMEAVQPTPPPKFVGVPDVTIEEVSPDEMDKYKRVPCPPGYEGPTPLRRKQP